MKSQCTLFVLCSQYVLFGGTYWACFDPQWSVLTLQAQIENMKGHYGEDEPYEKSHPDCWSPSLGI